MISVESGRFLAYTPPNPLGLLQPGARLGPYEIVAPLGAGGMGEVYRAHDSSLNRDVAIKVLLPSVADDPDRLARFRREAQLLAALNHPNIAHIHGLEDFPIEGGGRVRALIMELVEGDDLAVLIARGPMSVDEALPVARQIADALEAAHEQGIIHRDLKPANIKVRHDGMVKVLDFGLAKAMDPAGTSSADAMNSPTLSIHATQLGMILGTAAYMSPEQARGKAVDRRTDIWAFGAVLFEMLTGARAFTGDDVTDTIVSVVSREPDWAALPSAVPLDVRRLLARCLKKDSKARMRDMGEARLALDDVASGGVPLSSGPDGGGASPRPAGSANLAVAALCLLIGASLASAAMWSLVRSSPAAVHLARFAIVPPGDLVLSVASPNRDVAISPDGTRLVYQTGPPSVLHIRAIDQLESVTLGGVAEAYVPFVSPDSRSLGFFTNSTIGVPGAAESKYELKKVSLTGGPAITLCQVDVTPQLEFVLSASWGVDDTIVFATNDRATGLLRVPAGGGRPTVLTRPDPVHGELDHVLPFVLPGDRAVLFTIVPADGIAANFQVAVLDLKTGQQKTLIRGGSHAEYVAAPSPGGAAGLLVYAAEGALRAVRFDPARFDVFGDPVTVVDDLLVKPNGTADFSLSRTGVLVYVPATATGQATKRRTLRWVDRSGHEEPINAPARAYELPRISPDGTRLALGIRDQANDIWTWDIIRQTLTRLTFDPAVELSPIWTPDSRRIVFSSTRGAARNLYWHAADGTGDDHRLTTSANAQVPTSATPHGRHILAHETTVQTSNWDLVRIPLDPASSEKHPSEPLVHTPFLEFSAEISPDGRYVAYQSTESGQGEIHVRPYPRVDDGHWQVSMGGGSQPVWAASGRELFFVAGGLGAPGSGSLMSVSVQTTGATFSVGKPVTVLDAKFSRPGILRNFDVSRDGRRFLMLKDDALANKAASASLVVVLNWFEELKARVAK